MINQDQDANNVVLNKLHLPARITEAYPQYGSGGVLFPWKLHAMLETAESDGFTSVVSWLPDNRSFKVHDTQTFVSLISSRYFEQTKYKSFQRQLNLWGFERHISGPSKKGGYTHPCLVRGKPSLCSRMKRTKKASDKRNKAATTVAVSNKTRTTSRNSRLLIPQTKPLVRKSHDVVITTQQPTTSTPASSVINGCSPPTSNHVHTPTMLLHTPTMLLQSEYSVVSMDDDDNLSVSGEVLEHHIMRAIMEPQSWQLPEVAQTASLYPTTKSHSTFEDIVNNEDDGAAEFAGRHFFPICCNGVDIDVDDDDDDDDDGADRVDCWLSAM
jgi:hypothetical protein